MKVAVVGAGRVGAQWDYKDKLRAKPSTHAGAWKALGAHVTIADLDSDRTAEAYIGLGLDRAAPVEEVYYGNYDIISIATPPETHRMVLEKVVSGRPKVIFVEKPIATTVEDAEAMIRACEMLEVKLAVNHVRRWEPFWQEVIEIAFSKSKGSIVGRFTGDTLNVGIHMADIMEWIGVDGTVEQFGDLGYLLFELDVFFMDGRMRIVDNGAFTETYVAQPSDRYDGINELVFKGGMDNVVKKTSMLLACEQLKRCAETDEVPLCTGQDGLKALERCLGWMKKS